jgi:KaiC/GvpD/RAD55 family RecA-like ATPase
MKLGEQMLSLFRGHPEFIAVGSNGAFHPELRDISVSEIERTHLGGETCLGFYLVNPENCCWCSAVDFDNKPEDPDPKWREKAEQVYYALSECGLSPLVEISQSGEAAHVWLFFSEPTPAWIVRAWWRAVANKLGIEFKEIYPRQDVHTGKGLGNLIRYPLWNKSCFVSPDWDWRVMDPAEALRETRTTNATDLNLLAFQLGFGELRPEAKAAVQSVLVEGESALIPLRVQRLLEKKWTLIARRWNGDTEGMKDGSKSAVAMSIATELVRLYVPTPEVVSAVRHWCRLNGADAKADRDDWISRTVTKAYDFVLTRAEQKSNSTMTFQAASHLYLDNLERGIGIHQGSGIADLDRSIDGVAAGEVVVIAARPGHGKSAMGFQWLDYAAQQNVPGLLLSEEMAAEQVGKRHLSSVSRLSNEHWTKQSVKRLRKELDDYHAQPAPVHLVENCGTIDRAEEIIDQFCAMHGVGIVAVDYLQLLGGRATDRYEVVTEVSRRIKQCAARNGVRMLLLCQLNREVEKRHDNEPRLSDLRESGQIEQDADMILFLQWPCKFDANMPRNVYRIYCAKRRNGPIRQSLIETTFDPDRQIVGSAEAIHTPFDD